MSFLSALGKGLGGISRGVDRLGGMILPVDPAMAGGIDPNQLGAQRRQALFRMGLGLMDGGSASASFGAGADPLQKFVQTAYVNTERKRAEDKDESRYEADRQHQLDRESAADARASAADQRQRDEQSAAQKRWEAEQKQQDEARKTAEKLQRDQMALQEKLAKLKVDASETPKLRAVPAPIARAIVENRQNLSKIDRALEAVKLNPNAFGATNYLGDAVTQRLNGKRGQEGVDERAAVADIGSLIIHDRSGAAVSAAEFPRLKPFIPAATDTPATVKKKLEGLRAAMAPMVDDMESMYTPETGYMGVGTPQAGFGGAPAPTPGGLGQPYTGPGARPQGGVAQRAQGYY